MNVSVLLLLLAFCSFVASVEPENSDSHEWYINVWCKHYMEWALNTLTLVCVHQLLESRKRKFLGACVLEVLLPNSYAKKKYWVSPVLEYRSTHGYYRTGFSILHSEDLRFRNYCRMSPTQLENLVQMVGADIYKASFLREAIPVRERLVVTLSHMASGDSMASLASRFLIGDCTVCNIIHETTEALWRNLYPIVFRRQTRNDWRRIATGFEQKTHCPHCLGAIDGKHVVIQCPPNAGSGYY
ncbi:hypothetical protein QAD02_020382 [Eretmocerus hayati]|uniref:Uncharacterized protein n=1 Tax=Eretmocerus hayati TaxID=131215 RepID=A0ACC2PMC4_9HYME|nr:hypothetical protein QAD02_020382 [Eretmocerus hayati]